jgi:hypothetical protein
MKKAIFGDIVVEPGGLIVSKADNSKYLILKTVSEIIMVKDFNFITSGYTKEFTDLGREFYYLEST